MNKKYDYIKRIASLLIQSHQLKMMDGDVCKERYLVWTRISKVIIRYDRIKIWLWSSISAVASIVLLFILINSYKGSDDDSLEMFVQQVPLPSYNTVDINVYLSPEDTVSIKGGKADVKYSPKGDVLIKGKAKSLKSDSVIDKVENKEPKIEYNQIVVPKGKFTNLTLSDGSVVYINSGTRVVYPRVFASTIREIYVEGEIYIEVAKNKKVPFHVKTNSCMIEVLGTSFNVNAHKDEENTEVVLLEGSIKLSDKQNNNIKLNPDQMAMLTNGKMQEVKQVKAEDYITWKDGILLINDGELSSVLKRLERFYGCNIHVSDEAARLSILGKIDLSHSLNQVMELLSKTAPIGYKRDQDGNYSVYLN